MWKILLVDDDAVVRKGIRLSIDWRAQGFEVVAEAANGKRALELVGECHPDILLTDIRMPVCDGLWLCEQVAERYPEVRMVIFSGYEDFDYARRAIRVGVQEYIVKPVDAAFLLESLRKIAGSLARAEEARRFRARSEGVAADILGGRDITNAIVLHSVKYVEGNYMNDVDVCAVAGEMGISENYFSRIFKAETGINFIEFLNRYPRPSAPRRFCPSPISRSTTLRRWSAIRRTSPFTTTSPGMRARRPPGSRNTAMNSRKRFVSLRLKILVVLFVVATIPIMLTGYMMYAQLVATLTQKQDTASLNSLGSVATNVTTVMDNVREISLQIIQNEDLATLLKNTSASGVGARVRTCPS